MNRGCDTGGVIHRNNAQNMQDFRFSSQRCCWRFKRSEMWWCVNGRAVASILKACQSSSYEHSNLTTSDTCNDQNASIIMSQEVLEESVLEDSLTVKTKAQWFFKMLGTTCPRQSVTSHKTDSSCRARVSQQVNAKSARGNSRYRQTEWQEDFTCKGWDQKGNAQVNGHCKVTWWWLQVLANNAKYETITAYGLLRCDTAYSSRWLYPTVSNFF
jgi:hypothetical protein